MENVTLADLEGDTETSCTDTDERCPFWSSKGECEKNPWMKLNCPKSCKSCTKKESVKKKTLKVDLTTDERDILQRTADFGKVQTVAGAEAAETYEVIWKTIEYFDTEAHSLPEKVLKNCLNKNDLCSFWAVIGECKNNQSYMITNCAPACRSCALIDIEARCPPISNQKPALRPGELNKMFENIIENAPGNRTLSDDERLDLEQKSMPEYTVSVHSRPSESAITEINKANDMKSPPWVRSQAESQRFLWCLFYSCHLIPFFLTIVLIIDRWQQIVVFDNFTSAEECQHLIDLGHKHQYHRSRDYGAKQFDGTFENVESQRRTSENAWCSTHSGCRSEDIPQRIHNRMGEVMGIEPNNSEDFQILKYLNGQFYRQHHDYIQHHVDRQCGPRMLTFFLYLSDVEVGGGTKFNELGLTVQPKRGRAVLWPSVLNSDPLSKDPRTEHEALSVKEGTKYAANGWIHMYDYVAAHTRGCT